MVACSQLLRKVKAQTQKVRPLTAALARSFSKGCIFTAILSLEGLAETCEGQDLLPSFTNIYVYDSFTSIFEHKREKKKDLNRRKKNVAYSFQLILPKNFVTFINKITL